MSLRVGVIGLGVGEQHAAGYAAHPECEVVALCDLNRARLDEVGARFKGAQLLGDAEELIELDGLDVVSIASYDDAHHAQVVAALEAERHVFVEKPLCIRPEEAEEIRGLLDARPDLRLSSNLPLRRSPRFRALKTLIDGGGLGSLYYVQAAYLYGRLTKITEGWRGQLPFYSVTLGGGVHMADLLLWLTGAQPVQATAVGNAIATRDSDFAFNDFVTATITFDDGMIARLESNFGCVHPHFHDLRVYGTEGTWSNGLPDGELITRGDDGELETKPVTEPYPGVEKSDLIAPFVDWIIDGSAPEVTPDEIFAALELCFSIEGLQSV